MMFAIQDEAHAELSGAFPTREDAVAELQRLRSIAWDQPPNKAPCMSWRTCGRHYSLVEFDNRFTPWRTLSCVSALDISADGVSWNL